MSGSDALREEVDELREEINQLKQENSRRVGRNNSETGELTQSTSSEFSRRGFLKAAGIMGAAAMLPSAASFRINSDRGLSYYNSSSADKSQLQVTPDGVLEAQQIGTTSNLINSIHSQLVNTEDMNSVRVAESAEDIQPLIDELDGSGVTERPGGGVVQLKRGVYKPKKPIELQRGVRLRGLQHTINNDKNQQEFEYCAISGENLSAGDPIIKATSGADMVTVENLTLISGGTSNITGIRLTNITAPLLNNVRMNGLGGYGIFASGVFDGRARGMDVFNCGNISNSANAVYIEENPNTGNNSQMALNGSFTSIQKGESNTIIKLDGPVRASLVGGANRRAHLKMRNPDNLNIFQVSVGLNSLFTMKNAGVTGENDTGVHGIEVKQDLTLLNSKIEKVDQGIVIKERGARSEYVNSQITSCTQDGVKTYGGVQVPRMLGYNASGNGGHGLNFSGGVGGTPISNISVLGNGGAGIRSDVRRGRVEINGIEATNNTNGPVSHPATVEVSQSLNTAWPIRTTGIATFSGDGATATLDTDDLMKHLLTVGQSGSGKTTLFYNLMDQLEVPFWSFDLKQDYRHLAQEHEVLVLPWSDLRFNPVKPPPGVPPRRWAQVFSEVFGHATALLSGSKNHLLKQLITLYQLYELFNEVSEPYPSTHELEMLIEKEKVNYVRKTSNYRDTLLNRIEAINLTAGTVFDCSQGYPIEDLLQRNVVFEFDGLNRDVQNFLMEILFAYVYEYRLAQNQRDQGMNHVFFLDEGKHVFSVYKERQDASGIPEIDELTAKMREFGEGLVVADQEASKLTDSIKANTYTKILLPIGDRKQFNAISDSMSLSERQANFAQKLGIGEAVVQTGNGDPVPVQLENYDLNKSVTDEEIRRRQAEEWHDLSHEPRDTTLRFETYIAPGREDELEGPNIIDDPTEIKVSENADRLLNDIVENPFRSLLERYDEFSNRYQGNKAKNELVDAGLVVERTVKHGDNRKLLGLTENGRDYAEDSLDIDTEQQGRGGIIHQYWQHRIKQAFEAAGWDGVETEMFDADVYVHFGFMELMIEVAMTSGDREVNHIEERLDGGIAAVWVVCRDNRVREALHQKLDERGLLEDRVTLHLIQDFVEIDATQREVSA